MGIHHGIHRTRRRGALWNPSIRQAARDTFIASRSTDPARERHLHYWDGNALAISRSIAEAMTLEDMNLRDDCLLSMMSDIVDFRGAGPRGSSVRVMFSPLEKFAAMAMEPMGLAS